MLRRKRRNVGSQTERRACPRLLSHGQTFEKPKIVIFLLVTIVSMILPLTVTSLASAQQPAPQATGAVDSNGFPLKAPPGWNQKHWDDTLRFCRHIVEKARAHQALDEGEIAGSGICTSLSVDFFSPQGPPPGSYISPDRPHSAPSPTSLGSPQSENTASNLSVLSASSVGPVGVSFPGGGENACTTGQSQPPDVAADVSATQAVELLNDVGLYVYDKTGQLQSGYPQSLANFWFANVAVVDTAEYVWRLFQTRHARRPLPKGEG
jgi:hypothetical protein